MDNGFIPEVVVLNENITPGTTTDYNSGHYYGDMKVEDGVVKVFIDGKWITV